MGSEFSLYTSIVDAFLDIAIICFGIDSPYDGT